MTTLILGAILCSASTTDRFESFADGDFTNNWTWIEIATVSANTNNTLETSGGNTGNWRNISLSAQVEGQTAFVGGLKTTAVSSGYISKIEYSCDLKRHLSFSSAPPCGPLLYQNGTYYLANGFGPQVTASWVSHGPTYLYESDFREIQINGSVTTVIENSHPDFSGESDIEATFGFGNYGSSLGKVFFLAGDGIDNWTLVVHH